MSRQQESRLHFTAKERATLELVVQGVPVARMALILQQSPKIIERNIHHVLQKLERWSWDAAPGPKFHSAREAQWGLVNPREAERRIARIIHEQGDDWTCLVLLAMPLSADMMAESSWEVLTQHIHRHVRASDIVTKWSMTEWVIFFPAVIPHHAEKLLHSLIHCEGLPGPVLSAVREAHPEDSFRDVAMQCHYDLLNRYVNQDVASRITPTTS